MNQVSSRFSRIYPWFLCGLSFTIQFLVLGFYKGFGSVYVALQQEFKESDALTGNLLQFYPFKFKIRLFIYSRAKAKEVVKYAGR